MAIASHSQSQAPPPTASLPPKTNGVETHTEISLAQTPASGHSSFIDVRLDRLYASKTNPRKHFDGPDMDELVESVKQKGVLMPILVRDAGWRAPLTKQDDPAGIKYEVVAGERRFRAAQSAGLKTIPARVAELSDTEVLEIQIIENLQRKDVTSLEEADGYSGLFKQLQIVQPKAGKQELVADIAKKIGKSVRYVYARMKLTELCDEVKKALAAGEIPASHADELVRLRPADQKKALKDCCFDEEWQGGKRVRVATSVRYLKEAIAEKFHCNLSAAPWKWDDAKLVPLAGACNDCPKNTANEIGGNPEKAICIDSDCFGKKKSAFVKIAIDKVEADTGASEVVKLAGGCSHRGEDVVSRYTWENSKAKPGSCKFVKTGVVVDEDRYESNPVPLGKVITFCSAPSCKVHHPNQSRSSSLRSSRVSPEQRKKDEAKRAADKLARHAIAREILDAIKDLSGSVLDLAIDRAMVSAELFGEAGEFVDSYFGLQKRTAEAFNFKPPSNLTSSQKTRFLVALLLSDSLDEYGEPELTKIAKALGLDAAKIRDRAKATAQTSAQTAKEAAARKPDAAKKTSPKKAQAKGKQGGGK